MTLDTTLELLDVFRPSSFIGKSRGRWTRFFDVVTFLARSRKLTEGFHNRLCIPQCMTLLYQHCGSYSITICIRHD